jgi:hypothetical protein
LFAYAIVLETLEREQQFYFRQCANAIVLSNIYEFGVNQMKKITFAIKGSESACQGHNPVKHIHVFAHDNSKALVTLETWIAQIETVT